MQSTQGKTMMRQAAGTTRNGDTWPGRRRSLSAIGLQLFGVAGRSLGAFLLAAPVRASRAVDPPPDRAADVRPQAAEGLGEWNAAAFAAEGLPAALAALGVATPVPDDPRLRLEMPELAESGAVVPVDLASAIPGTSRLILLIMNNPNTLAADFRPGPQLWPRLSTRVKLAETTAVVAVAVTPTGVYSAQRTVKVTAGGCGG